MTELEKMKARVIEQIDRLLAAETPEEYESEVQKTDSLIQALRTLLDDRKLN